MADATEVPTTTTEWRCDLPVATTVHAVALNPRGRAAVLVLPTWLAPTDVKRLRGYLDLLEQAQSDDADKATAEARP